MSLKEEGLGEKAHAIHKGLIARRSYSRGEDWETAKILYTLRRYELWRFAVGGLESWDDYLKQPEIAIPRSRADKLIRIYDFFIVQNQYTIGDVYEVPWSSLDYISKKGQTLSDMQLARLIDDAMVLSLKDLKERFQDVAEPEEVRTYTYLLMRKCDQTGNLEKVHEITSEEIKTAFNL